MTESRGFQGETDEQLMRKYANGDYSAFEILYQRHSGMVYGFLRKRLAKQEEADEVFQSVFMKLHQSRSRYDPAYLFRQWLFVITRTSLLDHLRKSGRQVPIEDGVDPNTLAATQDGGDSPVQEHPGIASLSPEQRQAFEMRVMDELSYEQIAAKLNRTEGSVRQMVSRALRKLRALAPGSAK